MVLGTGLILMRLDLTLGLKSLRTCLSCLDQRGMSIQTHGAQRLQSIPVLVLVLVRANNPGE